MIDDIVEFILKEQPDIYVQADLSPIHEKAWKLVMAIAAEAKADPVFFNWLKAQGIPDTLLKYTGLE